MKKFFYFAAALVATVACTKTTVDELPDQVIGFAVANYSTQTKAEIDGKNTSAFPYDAFGVYAWYDADNEGEQHQVFMNNETVKKDGTNWKVYGKTYYWPKTGDVDFIAYYPQSASPWIAISDNGEVKAAKITGKIATTKGVLAGNEDYMYADKATNYTANYVDPTSKLAKYNTVSGVAAGVPTLFHHALAKVSVNIKATTLGTAPNVWRVIVKEAYFEKMATTGTCELTIASDVAGQQAWTLPTNKVWTGSNEVSIQAKGTTDVTLTTSDTATLSEWTVLPQALSGKKFYLKYTVETSNDGGSTYYSTETVVKEIPLDNKTSGFSNLADYWQMNKKITYNITINPVGTEIIFDPAVVEWDTVNAGTVDL